MLSCNLDMNYAKDRTHMLLHSQADYGIPLFVNHSSFWLRTAGGISPGKRTILLIIFILVASTITGSMTRMCNDTGNGTVFPVRISAASQELIFLKQ